MKMKTISILVIIILSGADPIGAQTYAVTLRPSTLGLCLEGIRSISSTLDARLGMSYLSFSLHGGSDQEDYTMDGDFNLSSVSTLIDWYPKLSPFHITGGLVLNFNDIKTLLTPSRSHEINGRVYTPGMLGNLSARVSFNKVAPYMGIGLGLVHPGTGFGYMFDIGAMYQGQPRVDLSATGLLEPSTEQEPIIEKNIRWFSFYPVVSFGLMYVFH